MKNRSLGIVLIGVLALLLLAVFWSISRMQPAMPDNKTKEPRQVAAPLRQGAESAANPTSQPDLIAQNGNVTLVARTSKIEPEEQQIMPHPDFVWYTSPTPKGSIKNSKGEVIFQATEEVPFSSLRSKAGIPSIVVVSNNRNAFVIDTETKKQIALPKQPPGAGMKGFETWEWIDGGTLLGESYVQAVGNDGKPVGCCEGHSIAETKLYIYDLKSSSLKEVDLPKPLKGTAFSVGRIANDGSVEIVAATTHLGEGASVGWFNLSKRQQ